MDLNRYSLLTPWRTIGIEGQVMFDFVPLHVKSLPLKIVVEMDPGGNIRRTDCIDLTTDLLEDIKVEIGKVEFWLFFLRRV